LKADATSATPSILRRLVSLLYESLLVAALLLVAAAGFYIAAPGLIDGIMRLLMQIYLGSVLAAYFLWCWCRSGQTLPMKTWRIRLVDLRGQPPAAPRALVRLGLAALTLGAACTGLAVAWKRPHETLGWALLIPGMCSLFWALLDRDRQFLHDRLAGTRLVMAERPEANAADPPR
jgi:uncharacterized RDD family membrane protein YckC